MSGARDFRHANSELQHFSAVVDTPDNASGYAMHSSRSRDAVIRVYDDAGNVIETHEHAGDFIEP